jgi:hypothetical protein
LGLFASPKLYHVLLLVNFVLRCNNFQLYDQLEGSSSRGLISETSATTSLPLTEK